MGRLNPLNDYLFQKIMGEKGDEIQLLSLLNAILARTGKQLRSVQILENKTLTADIIGDKTSILDVRAVGDTGGKVDMEVQLRDLHNTDKRSLFYWSNDWRRGIERGGDYQDLPNVIAINIVGFSHIKLDGFHTSFHIYEDRHKEYMLTDALEIHFIDMTAFRRLPVKDIHEPLHRWLMFLDEGTESKTLEEIIGMDYGIQKAQAAIDFVSLDRETLRNYDLRAMALADYRAELEFARKEGVERGIKEGVERGIKEGVKGIAQNLKAIGMSFKQISQVTGLTFEEIERL